MGYSLTNTTKKKSGGSSSSKGGTSITVTRSERESNRKGGSVSSGSSSSGGTSNSNTSGIKYDPNKDYAAEIQKAVQSGASQDYINGLNAQRDAKIKGEKLSYSSLTDSDIANYRKGGSLGGRKTYDSAGVIGGMDNGTYNIANPYKKNYSNFNADVDFDGKIAAAKASGASQETINGLLQQKEYSEKVRNGEITPMGYGEGMGHTNREHGFTFDLGNGKKQTVFGNATNYRDAAKLAGIDLDNGAKLLGSLGYGTASSAYAKPGYGWGNVAGPDDFTTNLYVDDKQTGNWYDQNNMQLQFLSGRDGMDYKNPYAGLAYEGNGMTNAYDKGTQFAGQGGIMGDYGVEGPNMDDIYANYGTTNSGYVGLTKDDIESQMNDAYEGYMDAVNERNDALAAAYASQIEQLKQAAEEEQRANYINYKLAGLNMPAQMQAAGINGGIAESTLAGLESDYMKNYNSTAGTLTNAINQLNIAQNNAIAEGNMEAANMYAQMQQNSLSLQMQAAQAENAYNQWVQEMAFARNQWEYEQARYNAEMAAREQQEAEDRALSELKYMAELGIKVGDTSYLQSMGFDTSYLDRYNDLTLQEKQASLLKKKASGRSSGGYNPIDEELDEKINGTPHSNAVTNYIDNTIKKSGIGAMAVGGYNQPLTGNQIKQYLTNGWLLADITGDKITIGSPAYFEALNR